MKKLPIKSWQQTEKYYFCVIWFLTRTLWYNFSFLVGGRRRLVVMWRVMVPLETRPLNVIPAGSFYGLFIIMLMRTNTFSIETFSVIEDKSDGCLSPLCFTVSCLFRQQMSHSLNNGLCYMSVNGNCQLCQSKSNRPSTNLALLNLHLMFSAKLADFVPDYIILCRHTF